MSSVSDKEYRETAAFIAKNVEPSVQKIIAKLNEYLEARGLHAGAELTWYIDHLPTTKKENQDEDKD